MRWWEKNFLFYELILSILVIFITWRLVIYFGKVEMISSVLKNCRLQLYGTIACVTGSLLGFVIAGMSILLTMGESEALNFFRKSEHYPLIFKVYISGSKYLSLTTILAIVALIADRDSSPRIWFTAIVCWGLLISAFRLFRCLWILEKMVEISIHNNRREIKGAKLHQ